MKNEDTMPNAIGVTVDVRRRRFSFNSPIYPQAIYISPTRKTEHIHTHTVEITESKIAAEKILLFILLMKKNKI